MKVTNNKGKETPGVDNIIWDTPEKKIQAARELLVGPDYTC
jgi:RNA-directed DNA polymerase